ncbi:ATP-binding protein [Archangium lansingense]|uniref:sensor histidine kinase n=1 Tax=Archangium lansingense TaxID=2995310 RepID=UPI003B7B04F1
MPTHHTRGSIARSTLIKMGARVAVIITLATVFSYLHILHTLRSEALATLQLYVSERSQREGAIFLLAEDNHAILKKVLAERIRALSSKDVSARFDRLFVHFPDGTVRNRAEGFDGTRMPGVVVSAKAKLDAELRRKILASYDVLTWYGPVFHSRFINTSVTLVDGAAVSYWPEYPTWYLDTPSPEVFPRKPEQNSTQGTFWIGAYSDLVRNKWMVAAITPLDMGGYNIATLGHDMLLDELMARTVHDHLPGAYNMLFRDDGELVVHPELRVKLGAQAYNILNDYRSPKAIFDHDVTEQQTDHLRDIFERVTSPSPGEHVLQLSEHGEYVATARLQGTGWNFVTVLPESVVTKPALQAARYVLLLGLLSLFLELLIMSWVLRQQLTRPLLAFTRATDQVAAGDFQVSLVSSRDDELGRLAHGFELMAQEIQRREEALRQANEGLESRIQERTLELQQKNVELEGALTRLKEAQELLVQKEKLASLGALTAGIAHEIKNPLNFVNNFAQLSVSLVEDLREELETQRAGQGGSSRERVDEMLEWLEQNVRKIDEHSRRADGIVRSMQQLHSHARVGEGSPTDLNALLEENLGHATGSMRSTHPGLEMVLRKELDPAVGKVDLVPQDFGRAILNLLDNSMYAVAEKKKSAGEGFTPEVSVSSRSTGTQVEIRIRDNGIGIPRKHQDKIFTPFFTTKPVGLGTGLGLSITYDIVVRQHRGELRVESTEGHFTECLIVLPHARTSG